MRKEDLLKMNNYYNIDTNAHYFVPMRPRSCISGFISFVSSSDPEYFIECEVQPYDIEGIDYKCYLVPVTEECKYNFGREEFYSCDFKSLLEKGRIIKKEITRGNEPNSLFDYWEVCADNRLFDEVYEGPVMISPKLVLSHEPIDCAGWAFNLHGHIHARSHKNDECHYNVCADCHNYLPLNLNQFLKSGALSKISSIHRQTIDEATARCKKRGYRLTSPKNK